MEHLNGVQLDLVAYSLDKITIFQIVEPASVTGSETSHNM